MRRNFVLEPIKTQLSGEDIKVKNFKNNLRYMSAKTIDKIYEQLDISEFNPSLESKEKIGNRDIIKAEVGGKSVYFYKSSGESRIGMNTVNYWFPCLGDCSQPINPFTGKKENRIRKLEDIYLNKEDKDIIEELKNNPDMEKYGRFITKENAMISKKLFQKNS